MLQHSRLTWRQNEGMLPHVSGHSSLRHHSNLTCPLLLTRLGASDPRPEQSVGLDEETLLDASECRMGNEVRCGHGPKVSVPGVVHANPCDCWKRRVVPDGCASEEQVPNELPKVPAWRAFRHYLQVQQQVTHDDVSVRPADACRLICEVRIEPESLARAKGLPRQYRDQDS